MQTWITADWHLGEDRFEIMQRPFGTPEEMGDVLKTNHNALVSPDDLVYVVGDVCYQKAPHWLPFVKEFNGRKILIRGNHDRVFSDNDLAPYFETIVPDGEGLNPCPGVSINPFYLVHYPSLARRDYFNLVGHIHGAWKFQLNSINVGVDVNHFRPLSTERDIPFFVKAISEFYDNDVWSAYSDANMSYRGIRGKQSSYFQQK